MLGRSKPPIMPVFTVLGSIPYMLIIYMYIVAVHPVQHRSTLSFTRSPSLPHPQPLAMGRKEAQSKHGHFPVLQIGPDSITAVNLS